MKIVIEVPEEEYNTRQLVHYFGCYSDKLDLVIYNGTPLPEHHGRIIDESQIKHIDCHTEQELCGTKIRYVKTTDAPTIIEGSESDDNIRSNKI